MTNGARSGVPCGRPLHRGIDADDSEMKVLAQVVAGLQDVIEPELARRLPDFRVLHKEQGLLIFESDAPSEVVAHLPFFNNSFVVLGQAVASAAQLESAVARHWTAGPLLAAARASLRSHERSFRLFVSDESRLVAVARPTSERLTRALQQATGLRHQPGGADVEFWSLRRREGVVYFCRRLSRRSKTERDLARGELRPELASLLCLLSQPASGDVFLDPFAGSGAIGFVRAEQPFRRLLLSDSDPDKVAELNRQLKRRRLGGRPGGPEVSATVADARRLQAVATASVDKVVTDPPWGFFDRSIGDPVAFYRTALAELVRVLAPDGRLVLLSGQREIWPALNAELAPWLEPLSSHEILLSGKKAVILAWRRSPRAAP
jgi:16S rRNA G966 N2-methylase RsmD